MEYFEFLDRIIEDGIKAAKESYADSPDKLRGSVAGFEACRKKDPVSLAFLLQEARDRTLRAHLEETEDYWEARCFELEVEWTCNCVSAIMMNCGMQPIIRPTARGVIKAAEVAGVGEVGGAPN